MLDGNFKETKDSKNVCYIIHENGDVELCTDHDTEYLIITKEEIQKLAKMIEISGNQNFICEMKLIAWRYCKRCGKVIELNYFPFNRTISEELDIREEEHQLHLCKSCSKEFPTCDARKVIFGTCIGNDNVIECDKFIERRKI